MFHTFTHEVNNFFALYSFVYIHISIWYYFPSVWKASYNVFYSMCLLVMDLFSFFMSENIFTSVLPLKYISRIYSSRLISFFIKDVASLCFHLHCLQLKPHVSLIFVALYISCLLSLGTFRFFLFITIFEQFGHDLM